MTQPKHRHYGRALLLLSLCACQKIEQNVAALQPGPVVKVAEAVSRDVPIYVEAIGQTIGNTEIEISARVEGFLETMNFEQGSFVKKGRVLYTIDSRPFKTALAQAKAQLAQAQAELSRAHQDVARYEPLVAKNAVSVQDLETARSHEHAEIAAVAAAQAVADRAEIELGYTTVTAPDDGLIGTTEAYPGTLVGRGETTILAHLSKIDPIHARFNISERDYLYYARKREKANAAGNAGAKDSDRPDTEFQMLLADGSTYPHKGSLVYVDRNVDAKTGTIRLEASFPNPGGMIRPGQYARVRAAVDVKRGAVVVSQGSLQEVQGVNNVAVINAEDKVELRMVKPGERIGGLVILDSGVKAGERVVVEGQMKVKEGSPVKPVPVPAATPATPAGAGG